MNDGRFEIPAKRHLGLVVFRLKGDENDMTEELLKKLRQSGKMFAVSATLKDKVVIRYVVTSARTTAQDIDRDWCIVQKVADEILGGTPLLNQPSLLNSLDEQNYSENWNFPTKTRYGQRRFGRSISSIQ